MHKCWLATEARQREACSSCYQISHKCLTACPSPSQANAPASLSPCHSMALDLGQPMREKTGPWNTEMTQFLGRVWVGWWWPLLFLTQVVSQKQHRSLREVAPPKLIPQHMPRVHRGPTALWCGSTTRFSGGLRDPFVPHSDQL